MRRSILLATIASIAAGGCSGAGELAIRTQAAPLAEGRRPADFRVAEARSHFALGNVALALQGFRAALREEPSSVDALNGLAACYDRMGRFDLSRRYYEQALALAPSDPRLYANLATSLDLQGRPAEAASVRAEAALRLQTAPVRAEEVKVAAVVAPAAPSGKPAATMPVSASPADARVADTAPAEIAVAETAPEPKVAERPSTAPSPAPRVGSPTYSSPAASVTVALAPAARVRLERVSLAEVELVTRAAPIWQSEVVSRSPRSTTIAFRPVQPRITLLNAARVQGLAARTRSLLEQRGWRQVSIGDAPAVLRTSVLAYPAERRGEALRLARQFGFGLRHQRSAEGTIVLLLGRDAKATLKRAGRA